MKLLLIDDASDVHEEFTTALTAVDVTIVSAYSRDEALALLAEDYDLIVCDLKLPPDDSGGEPNISHGLSVSDAARSAVPGVPVVILSAFGELDDLEDRLAEAPREPFLAGAPLPLLRHRVKRKIDEVVELVQEHAAFLYELHAMEIAWGADAPAPLTRYERQALLLYAKSRGGAIVRAKSLLGGRSGATVLWVEIEAAAGTIVSRGVVKIGTLDGMGEEAKNYSDHVSDLLPAGSYAGAVNSIRAGAGRCGLIVYSLARPDTLFDVLREDVDAAALMASRLEEATRPWHGSLVPQQLSVREIRRLLVSDDDLVSIRTTHGDFIDFGIEDLIAQIYACRSHGDLHGGNVHATADRSPMLIDFGRVAVTPACLDPITLEVSAVLHPDAKIPLAGWPTVEQAESWHSEDFLEGCPIVPFVKACRVWLDAVRRGDRDRDATLYAYALRQLRYEDVPPEIPLALSRGAAARLLN